MKTTENSASVRDFLAGIEDPQKRKDCRAVARLMKAATGKRPKMWGSTIVGYGRYHYKYESGREGDFFLTGYSPRKQNLTLYVMDGFDGSEDLLRRLGKHKTGKSCLYVKRLEDVDLEVLDELIRGSVTAMREKYPD
ncbi:MAG: DUF1801 domain-containing protein [Acidobacteriota bacterium]